MWWYILCSKKKKHFKNCYPASMYFWVLSTTIVTYVICDRHVCRWLDTFTVWWKLFRTFYFVFFFFVLRNHHFVLAIQNKITVIWNNSEGRRNVDFRLIFNLIKLIFVLFSWFNLEICIIVRYNMYYELDKILGKNIL